MTDTKNTDAQPSAVLKANRAAQRVAFEAWLLREQGLTAEWQESRNCYKEFPAHLAYKAWRAAQGEPAVDSAEFGPALLSPEQIETHGLACDLQAFRNAEFRASQGSSMTSPERKEHDQQHAFARAVEADVRQAVAHRLWCAEVNLDGAGEHIAELQQENAILRAELEHRPRPAACVACEGNPSASNSPCAVCGRIAAPSLSLRAAILALPCEDSKANEEYSDRRSAYWYGHRDGLRGAAALVGAAPSTSTGQKEGA